MGTDLPLYLCIYDFTVIVCGGARANPDAWMHVISPSVLRVYMVYCVWHRSYTVVRDGRRVETRELVYNEITHLAAGWLVTRTSFD